jgi:hypothetical protein
LFFILGNKSIFANSSLFTAVLCETKALALNLSVKNTLLYGLNNSNPSVLLPPDGPSNTPINGKVQSLMFNMDFTDSSNSTDSHNPLKFLLDSF